MTCPVCEATVSPRESKQYFWFTCRRCGAISPRCKTAHLAETEFIKWAEKMKKNRLREVYEVGN